MRFSVSICLYVVCVIYSGALIHAYPWPCKSVVLKSYARIRAPFSLHSSAIKYLLLGCVSSTFRSGISSCRLGETCAGSFPVPGSGIDGRGGASITTPGGAGRETLTPEGCGGLTPPPADPTVSSFLLSAAAATSAVALAFFSTVEGGGSFAAVAVCVVAATSTAAAAVVFLTGRRLGLCGFGWEVLVVSNVARGGKSKKANVRHKNEKKVEKEQQAILFVKIKIKYTEYIFVLCLCLKFKKKNRTVS